MAESTSRIAEQKKPPCDTEIAAWLDREAFKYWKLVQLLIDKNYAGVFTPEWLFGGKKHGWSLRYKKSKSFCTLIPEKKRFAMLIVFGAEEQTKVEKVRDNLSASTRKEYDKATVYHDGK